MTPCHIGIERGRRDVEQKGNRRGTEAKKTEANIMLQAFCEQAAEASRKVLTDAKLSARVERCRHGDVMMFCI